MATSVGWAQAPARAAQPSSPEPVALGNRRDHEVPARSHGTAAARWAVLGSGQPLPDATREHFEPRFGYDFSGVRIHTDRSASAAARGIEAAAYTFGDHVVLDPAYYAPDTRAGRRLIAHELAHVVEHQRGAPLRIQREPISQAVQRRRELATIPSGLNYELRDHRLTAHTTEDADIDRIVEMLDVLALYAATEIDAAATRQSLLANRAGRQNGERVSIDVTPLLPSAIRSFLTNLENFYQAQREFIAREGTREEIFQRMPNDTPERREALSRYDRAGPLWPGEWHAICHEFSSVAVSGTQQGVSPGRGFPDPFSIDSDALLDAYLTSIHGRGPYRSVPARNVRAGDIAVFRAGRAIPGLPTRIIHSAVVIRVSGNTVELLEKKDPHKAAATRTVREVLDHYAAENATVQYLAPALTGLPFTSARRIGDAPPSGAFTSQPGRVGPEDTHVLFLVNTNVLHPHEDIKLFRVIARHRSRAATVRVHGYSSLEGPDDYNMNLSAHRAVSIKDGLTPQLATGSAVEAIAHGETDAFGSPDENRRAGIEVRSAATGTSPSTTTPEAPAMPAPLRTRGPEE